MKFVFFENNDPSQGVAYDAPTPIIKNSFLDEELDNTAIELIEIDRAEPFAPFTICEMQPPNESPIYWTVASDTSVKDIATGRYTHTVQLIEPTKWLERWMVGNKAVTQKISNYQDNEANVPIEGQKQLADAFDVITGLPCSGGYTLELKSTNAYTLPVEAYKDAINIYLPAAFSTFNAEMQAYGYFDAGEIVYVLQNGNIIREIEIDDTKSFGTEEIYESFIPEYGEITLVYIIIPKTASANYYGEYSTFAKVEVSPISYSNAASTMIATAQNLLEGEDGIFSLDSSSLPSDNCPEIVVSNATLREALDEIGKTFGTISRLDISKSGNKFAYTIGFEKFCKDDTATLPKFPGEVVISQSCEDYCTALDATVDNLVQYADGGTIIDPSADAFRTLRSEDASYRVTEGNCEILTEFPIERLDRLWVSIKGINSGKTKTVDITKYCYESSEYSILSSYIASYPYSKAYALEYTLGSKGIRSLNFEQEAAVSQLFKKPAIVNIINREFKTTYNDLRSIDFTKILFRAEYVPTGTARVRMRKPWSGGMNESVLPFNQSAAKLDSVAFGRAMFGNVIRMGNAQTAYTFTLPLGYVLPERGQRVGADGYIAEVKTEYGAASKKVTIVVVQGFNRLSAYVGVNQTLRLFEISERMSLDRHLIVEDFCAIGTVQTDFERPTSVKDNLVAVFENLFSYGSQPETPRIIARATGYSQGYPMRSVFKPCLTYALGNSIVISFGFLDNYSAGRRIDNILYQDDFFRTMTDVPYADAFGRIDLLDVDFMRGIPSRVLQNDSDQIANDLAIANAFPAVDSETINNLAADYFARFTNGANAIVVNKDSREAIKGVTYQINIMERDGVKVSPTFAERTGFGSKGSNLFLVLLNKPINNLTQTVSDKIGGTSFRASSISQTDNGFSVTFGGLPSGLDTMRSWAVIDGAGRFCFGKNERMKSSSLTVYFSFYH